MFPDTAWQPPWYQSVWAPAIFAVKLVWVVSLRIISKGDPCKRVPYDKAKAVPKLLVPVFQFAISDFQSSSWRCLSFVSECRVGILWLDNLNTVWSE